MPKINIIGEMERKDEHLSIHYKVSGETDQIVLPALSKSPTRKDDLWKATCFEFFIAIKDKPKYWEFNMSPSGDWNIYAMDAYRQVNMREEKVFEQLPFEFESNNTYLSLNISVDVSPIIRLEQNLLIGIATIIQPKDKSQTYWALTHPTSQADFHTRESFILSL
ncbi:MAG TPA: DOMON-like domain-containing protein [Anaerolineales bacterium]|nr:DOMON-like domain-containing protein [Anaerolineales bacterium]